MRFYGVHIPRELLSSGNNGVIHVYETYEEVSAVLKENRIARFKIFDSKEKATYFALHGSEGGQGNPNVVSESIPFKSLKRPEIYAFRRHIENDDYDSVNQMIWENPRYLISVGDTPVIMQEGPRYNALHIAAKHNRPRIAELILKTVSNVNFIKRLYGAAGENSYVTRPEVLLDLYLNTPDKGLNETPLHFAAKYGSVEVIKIFIQYPLLQICVKNKHQQSPKDIICNSATGKNKSELTQEIQKLLDEVYFVPIWRSDDNTVQPVIGQPFSPKSPPASPMITSPLSPPMEIKAVAGPMNLEEATNFHKTWRSPLKMNSATVASTPHVSKGFLLRSPLDSEKGLEKVGRNLAKKFHISWKEYWPFLDQFLDLSSEVGLKELEKYLENQISDKENNNNNNNANSKKADLNMTPISALCSALSRITISSPSGDRNNNVTPYLFMENICAEFAESVLDTFVANLNQNMPIEDNVVALIKRVRNLLSSVESCRKEPAFRHFQFDKVHPRVAHWITGSLCKIKDTRLSYATSTFRLLHKTDKSELLHRISFSPSSSSMNVELENIVRTLKCINGDVVRLLAKEVVPVTRPKDETNCRKEWSTVECCSCSLNNSGFFARLPGVNRIRRALLFEEKEEPVAATTKTDEALHSSQVTNNSSNTSSCDKNENLTNEIYATPNDDSDDEPEIFATPPESAPTSDDEMCVAEEGPEIFIYSDLGGTNMDNTVLEAINDVNISPITYPNIYRWKHSVLLHSTMTRFSWPPPRSAKNIKR